MPIAEPGLAGRPPWLAILPNALFRPAQPARYVALAAAFSFFPSVLLAAVAAALLPNAARPEFPTGSLAAFLLIVVASPVVETLVMAAALDLLRRRLEPAAAVLASAIGWGLLHSLMAAGWGLVVWWPFLVFSIAFVTWRSAGFWPAAGLVAIIHALQNLPVALLLLAGV